MKWLTELFISSLWVEVTESFQAAEQHSAGSLGLPGWEEPCREQPASPSDASPIRMRSSNGMLAPLSEDASSRNTYTEI